MNYKPHEYQKRGIKFLLQQACGGLFLDPGLGKTPIVLAVSDILRKKQFVKGVLIAAPLRVIYNVWPEEAKKWKEFNHLTFTTLHGAGKEELWTAKTDFYLINYEALPWLAEQLTKRRPADWPFDMVVFDESTRMKDSQTKRFKAFRPLLNSFKRRYILTGTPAPNGLMDLFGQAYLMDLGNALGRFITHYRNSYFYSTGYGGYTYLPQLGAMERITERLNPLVVRMRREDYLSLPPLQNQYMWLDLPPQARRIYDELHDQFITRLTEEEVVTAPSAAAAGIKCRQVLNGALYINEQHDWQEIHDAKLDALLELVEELSGQSLLVFYEFRHDLERIQRKLGWKQLGNQSAKKDAELIDLFNKGLLPGLLAHPASAGHGLNLQAACSHICWFGLTWNFEHYDQSIQRVWRQGQQNRVIVHHLCVRRSLDETVVRVLGQKDHTQTTFQNALLSNRDRA